MRCKLKIEFKTGEKVGYEIGVLDTVVIDGAFIKIFEHREDDSTVLSKIAWAEVKKIKIKEVKYI